MTRTNRRVLASSADAELLALRSQLERLQATIVPRRNAHRREALDFAAIIGAQGPDLARRWARRTGYDARIEDLEKRQLRASAIVERMIALRPRSPAGVAAVAASLKEDDSLIEGGGALASHAEERT